MPASRDIVPAINNVAQDGAASQGNAAVFDLPAMSPAIREKSKPYNGFHDVQIVVDRERPESLEGRDEDGMLLFQFTGKGFVLRRPKA